MTVRVVCKDPTALGRAVYKASMADEIGTWDLTGPEKDHRLEFKADQWKGVGAFRLVAKADELHCQFEWKGRPEEKRVLHCWAAYHTDLAQMFLVHFQNVAIDVRVAPPTQEDLKAK